MRLLVPGFLILALTAPGAVVAGGDLVARIRAEAGRLYPALVEARRWFHQRPELSNREVGTAAEVARRLRAIGLEVRTGVAHNGVVATLRGGRPGPTVAWRSDMDALPISEQVDVPYRSQTPGVMHACGHDVHMTVGLGVAELLWGMRGELPGTVIFIFQPAEEGAPAGEEGGASLMIAEGVLGEPPPAAILGLHVMPTLPVGQVGWRAGGTMAAADLFRIKIIGRSTHGSAPQEGIDAVVVAAHVVLGLQEIASRELDARRPVVVSVGSLHAGNRSNIIAGEAVLEGTVRTLDEATHAKVPEAMERIVAGICQAYRARYELEYTRANPINHNDEALAGRAAAVLERSLGAEHVVEAEPIMAAEDFAYFSKRVPGFYFFLGVRNEAKGMTSYLHSATFQPDEAAIETGVEAAANLIVAALNGWR